MTTDPTKTELLSDYYGTDPLTTRVEGYVNHTGKWFSAPFMSEIMPGLWLGGCKTGLVLPAFIKHVVSLYPWEAYTVRHELDSSVTFKMHDSVQEVGSTDYIIGLASWVNLCRSKKPTLVHCQAGINRSSLITGAGLILDGCSAEDVIELIREKRGQQALSNPAFCEWLFRFERTL